MDSAHEPANKEVLRDPGYLGRLCGSTRDPSSTLTQCPVDGLVPRFTARKVGAPGGQFRYHVLRPSRADYVVLENLLLLVLIVAPGFESMGKRSAFVHEAFVMGYPEDTICGENLARILTKPTERDSDVLQAQAIDILAKSNLML